MTRAGLRCCGDSAGKRLLLGLWLIRWSSENVIQSYDRHIAVTEIIVLPFQPTIEAGGLLLMSHRPWACSHLFFLTVLGYTADTILYASWTTNTIASLQSSTTLKVGTDSERERELTNEFLSRTHCMKRREKGA